MREYRTGIRSQPAPWASQRLRNALVVCCPRRRNRGQLITVRCFVTPGNGVTPPKGVRRKAASAAFLAPPKAQDNSAKASPRRAGCSVRVFKLPVEQDRVDLLAGQLTDLIELLREPVDHRPIGGDEARRIAPNIAKLPRLMRN